MLNNNLQTIPSPVGKTLYAKVLEDNLDGTFTALLSLANGKYEFICRLYHSENNDDMTSYLHKIILHKAITLECCDIDNDGIVLVKIIG